MISSVVLFGVAQGLGSKKKKKKRKAGGLLTTYKQELAKICEVHIRTHMHEHTPGNMDSLKALFTSQLGPDMEDPEEGELCLFAKFNFEEKNKK